MEHAGKSTHITGFNDPNISDSLALIDLVDAVRKGTIDYSLVKPGHTQQVFLLFAFEKTFQCTVSSRDVVSTSRSRDTPMSRSRLDKKLQRLGLGRLTSLSCHGLGCLRLVR